MDSCAISSSGEGEARVAVKGRGDGIENWFSFGTQLDLPHRHTYQSSALALRRCSRSGSRECAPKLPDTLRGPGVRRPDLRCMTGQRVLRARLMHICA